MAGWAELSDLVLRISWVGEGKATIFLGKHSARKFPLTPLRIRGDGPTVTSEKNVALFASRKLIDAKF